MTSAAIRIRTFRPVLAAIRTTRDVALHFARVVCWIPAAFALAAGWIPPLAGPWIAGVIPLHTTRTIVSRSLGLIAEARIGRDQLDAHGSRLDSELRIELGSHRSRFAAAGRRVAGVVILGGLLVPRVTVLGRLLTARTILRIC